MIRGCLTTGATRRPFVSARLQFPNLGDQLHPVEFLVDTGADRTILSPLDAMRLGLNLDTLESGLPSTGVGGQAATRTIEAVLTIDSFSTPLTLTIVETSRPIPSLLGRDVISHFALFMEERTNRVLLLEPSEADALNLPA
jgi:predicted aspartyl protease